MTASDVVGLDTDKLAGKYLTFTLGGEEYGIEILCVREIIGIMETTEVPKAPGYVRGVINLRGKIIPVLSLRRRFDMADRDDTEKTCIIVVDNKRAGDTSQVGIVVDSVCEVLDIDAQAIELAPEMGGHVPTEYVRAMAKCGDGVKILLAIGAVLGDRGATTEPAGAC